MLSSNMNVSLTITSLVVLVAGILGVGEIFPKEEVANVVNAIMQIIGVLGIWYGRIRLRDLHWWGGRK